MNKKRKKFLGSAVSKGESNKQMLKLYIHMICLTKEER